MVPQGEASFPTSVALFHVVMYHADVSTNHSIQLFGALFGSIEQCKYGVHNSFINGFIFFIFKKQLLVIFLFVCYG